MTEARKVAAILVTDIVGFSRLVGTDEEGTLARLRALQSELIDPTVAVHGGRIVKRTGDGAIVEFRSVVEAVRCAAEVRDGLAVRNADLPADQRIEVRTGIHLGDVVEEADGDLMGDGVNIAARLEGVATAGGIYLSEDAYRQVRNKIKADFIDLGEKELKNIVQRIRVYAVKNDSGDAATPVASLECRATPRLSIVVLPFSNIGDDPAQDYFVNGVTESLTTDLSRISGAFVIGRHTAFTYKDKQVDLKQVGRELNVRYVLEGSVQRGGNRMRINAQLVDAETGAHLWAERFDKPVADLFEMQDEIVARLARQLDAALIAAEARRAERAPRPSSMDLFFQGMRSLNRGVTPSNLTEAVSFFEGALAADPDNVDALAWLAAAYAQFAGGLSIDDRAVPIAAAEAAATKALYLAPEHPMAHLAMSIVYGVSNSNRLEMAIAECERCLALDRNLASAHAVIGVHKLHLDRAEETEAHVREAFRLSPRDVWAFEWFAISGYASDFLRRYEDAVAWQRRSIEANGNYPVSHFHLASALAHLDRLEEARAAARAGLALDPKFTTAWFRRVRFSNSAMHLAWRERLVDGMIKAGVPLGEMNSDPA